MMKTASALTAVTAALLLASCQKEAEPGTSPEEGRGGMVITAISEGIGTAAKASTAYRYDILWDAGDKIIVKGSAGSDTFTLRDGAGTTMGTFGQDHDSPSFSGEVEAFYPSTVADGNALVWPSEQRNGQVPPMYCKQAVSGSSEVFNFSSLGAILQLVFNSTAEDTVLKSIEIKDGGKSMSGAFTVDGDGQAVITAADGRGITLDLGPGKALGKGANYFNIAVPAGKYDDVTLSFYTTDGHVCTMHSSTLPEIERNTVCKVTLTGSVFGSKTLPGTFSVGGGKVVQFAPGNLYWDGDSYEFEAHQYDYPTLRSASHLGHFYWSGRPEVARAASYDDPGKGQHDVLFTNAAEDTASPGFTVSGITGRFRTLSMLEWRYLFESRSNADALRKVHVNVCGNADCLVIAPDGFKGVIRDTYSADEWKAAEADGLVCLPLAGCTFISDEPWAGAGYYWSSAPWTDTGAQYICFTDQTTDVVLQSNEYFRNHGCAVRLVRDKEFVTGVSLGRATLDLSLKQSVKLTATVLPADAPDRSVIWTSDNPEVATVSDDGTVFGAAAGTATITATTRNASKTASCTVTVSPHFAGVFSVNEGRTVSFSRGNMYWDGDSYEFEAHQYDSPTVRSASHLGHFFWSNDPEVARDTYYGDPERGQHDVLFTNAAEDTAAPGFTVCGITGRYRTLSMPEWKYLFQSRSNAEALFRLHVTVCGKEECLIIAPDGFKGGIGDTYDAEAWEAAEANGLICLPNAGYSLISETVYNSASYYWSSSPWTDTGAQYIGCSSGTTSVVFRGEAYTRSQGIAMRLVTDVTP